MQFFLNLIRIYLLTIIKYVKTFQCKVYFYISKLFLFNKNLNFNKYKFQILNKNKIVMFKNIRVCLGIVTSVDTISLLRIFRAFLIRFMYYKHSNTYSFLTYVFLRTVRTSCKAKKIKKSISN